MSFTPEWLSILRYKIILGALLPVLALSLAGCNGKIFGLFLDKDTLTTYLPFLIPQITSIAVTPSTASAPSGVPVDFNVTATFGNNHTRALTIDELQHVTW